MTTSTLTTIALTTRMVSSDVKPLTAREYWPLTRRIQLSLILGRDAADVARDAAMTVAESERLLRLLDRSTAVALAMDRLEQMGVWTLTPEDVDYPARLADRLRDAAPPVLHGVGPRAGLARAGLGIVGARDVTPEGADVARRAARTAVNAGLAVVSGAARGVDQQAMAAAFEAGGAAVGVLADALLRVTRQSEIRAAVLDERVTLLTPYAPEAGFSAGNAMGRNKIIYALARKTLVVCTNEGSGGTWAGATEALKGKYGHVSVWRGRGQGSGNEALISLGGELIEDLGRLTTPPEPPTTTRVQADQLTMNI